MTGPGNREQYHGGWYACYRTAFVQGVPAALDRLSAGLGGDLVVGGPQGHIVAPRTRLAAARRVWYGGVLVDRAEGAESVVPDRLLEDDGLVGLWYRGPLPEPAGAGWVRLWIGLAWLRLGLSERLLDDCRTYLAGRTAGGAPLLDQQLVKSELAGAVTGYLQVRAVLAGATAAQLGPDLAGRAHQQLTEADRLLLRLLGASGYLADGPGRRMAISELLGDVYLGNPVEELP